MIRQIHLTHDVAVAWKEGRLQPKQIAEIADHLSGCVPCRERVAPADAATKLASALECPLPHLTYEDLEQLAGRHVSGEDLVWMEQHLAACQTCAGELADLREFVRQQQPVRFRKWWIVLPVIAAAAALVLALRDTTPATVAFVVDSGRIISLDAAGQLHGVDGAAPATKAAIADVLRKGELPASNATGGLRGQRDTLLGLAGSPSAIRAVSPVAIVTLELTPVFRWSAPADATKFKVAVFTTNFEQVATSGDLSTNEWLCTTELQAGTTYIWTIATTVGGKRILSPKAPEPEVRFRTATRTERADFAAAKGLHSNLAMAIAATRAGMYAEAEQALGQLGATSPLTEKLRESMRQRTARK